MSDLLVNTVPDLVDNEMGYTLGLFLHGNELENVRSLVKTQWLENLKKHAPEHLEKILEYDLPRYHEISSLVNHALIWPKINRILPKDAVDYIRSTSLVKSLEEHYGEFIISDEEEIGREEIYWRLVRPNESSDMGPLHADAWFWELGHGNTQEGFRRVKVWVALYCQPGKNGLRIVPGSHKGEWPYHGEERNGFVKPQIDVDENDLPVELVYTKPGDAIVFNDRLLHGGAPNNANTTRVSLEFT